MDKHIKIDINSEMLKLIAEIDEFKGEWTFLKNIAPEKLNSLRKIATIESVGSSTRIEGAKLSDYEVDTLLSNIEIKSFKSRDEEEIAGYAKTINIIYENFNHIKFNENYIKQLHGFLLKYSAKDIHHKGKYKKVPNHVEAFDINGKSIGIIFKTASPFETPELMRHLMENTVQLFKQNIYHPLLITAYFIIHFLAIHPFQDGNGRLSRILTNLLLLQNGYQYIQYSSLEHIIEENKDKYYQALRKSQKKNRSDKEDITDWIIFFINCLKKQKDNLLKKIHVEYKLDALPEISNKILQLVKEHGKMTNQKIVAVTGFNRNTVKVHLKKLVQSQYLKKYGQGKGIYYTLKKSN